MFMFVAAIMGSLTVGEIHTGNYILCGTRIDADWVQTVATQQDADQVAALLRSGKSGCVAQPHTLKISGFISAKRDRFKHIWEVYEVELAEMPSQKVYAVTIIDAH